MRNQGVNGLRKEEMKDDYLKKMIKVLADTTFDAKAAKAKAEAKAKAKVEAEAKAKAEAEAKARAEAPAKIAEEALAIFWEKAQEVAEDGRNMVAWNSVFHDDEYGLNFGTREGFSEVLEDLCYENDKRKAVWFGKYLFVKALEDAGFIVYPDYWISWEENMRG